MALNHINLTKTTQGSSVKDAGTNVLEIMNKEQQCVLDNFWRTACTQHLVVI